MLEPFLVINFFKVTIMHTFEFFVKRLKRAAAPALYLLPPI